MIIKKNDDRDLLSTDVIGSSVAHSKRWLVAIVRILSLIHISEPTRH